VIDQKLSILQHSLGVDEYGQGRQYRNRFVTSPGTDDYDHCVSLVADGLMTKHPGNMLTGGNDLFVVTPKGVDFVAANSPKPPKLTRSQKRYEDWLAEDGTMSFGQWLKAAHGKRATS